MPLQSRSSRPDHPGHHPSAPPAPEEHSQQYSPPPSAQYSQLNTSPSPPHLSPAQQDKALPPPSVRPQQKHHLPSPPTAHPKRHLPPHPPAPRIRFDPWNSSSSGHQTDNHNRLAGSTTWRASRTAKLARQFEGGGIADSGRVRGAEKERDDGDENKKGGGGGDPVDFDMEGEGERVAAASTAAGTTAAAVTAITTSTISENQPTSPAPSRKRKIFHGLQMYINGSTAPLVSDHRLKQLLVQHGAGVCISLARRTVTHVILGTPNSGGGGGAGGGLAARKMQKEISRVRGCGVKYVGVEWILQSIQAGHRLPEARFSLHPAVLHQVRGGGSKGLSQGLSPGQGQNQRLGLGQRARQKSVYDVFGRKEEDGK